MSDKCRCKIKLSGKAQKREITMNKIYLIDYKSCEEYDSGGV